VIHAYLAPPLALSGGAIVSTLTGGLFALRLRTRLPFVLAFTTGVVLGIVVFDLLPEVFKLAHGHDLNGIRPMTGLGVAFLLFRAIEELLLAGTTEPADTRRVRRHHPHAGLLSAWALIGHSTLDGVSIGLAFQVSSGVGLVVAIAVIAHDFADGINTVGVMIAHGNRSRHAALMLVADAVAPVVGALSTRLVRFPPDLLVLFLGFFAGFLLHIATSASHAIMPGQSRWRVGQLIGVMTVGAAFAFAVSRLAR
jgi:ZIP family zinc transporter